MRAGATYEIIDADTGDVAASGVLRDGAFETDGAGTLCSTCGARFRGGHLGPPPRNAFGQIECECGRAFDKLNALATHKRSCRVAQMMPEE